MLRKTLILTSILEGTLASLRLQAKQLEELNEELLLESSRWSGAVGVRG